jgi:WD40 repeat protein
LPRSLFTGRRTVMTALAQWMAGAAAQPGLLRVVVGSPGSGKSAILGALVCTAHERLRQTMPEIANRLPGECQPPIIEDLVVVHARNRDVAEIAASIGLQLGLSDPIPAADAGALAAVLAGRDRVPVIVIDAADEATDPVALTRSLLMPLVSTGAVKLLVGTRPWADQFGPLLDAAAARGGLVDLDQVPARALRADLTAYLNDMLAHSHHYRDAYELRSRVAATAAKALTRARMGSEYLAAGLFADYLDSLPAPLRHHDRITAALPDSLDKLLELRLARLGSHEPLLRPVLATLAHAKGTGIPRDLLTAATATFAPDRKSPDEATVARLLGVARFYLRRSVESDGTMLYRLFHQAFDDRLVARPRDPDRLSPATEADTRMLLERLLDRVRLPDGQFAWDRAAPYLRRHAVDHAADAGRLGLLLTDVGFLTYADPERLLRHLAAAPDTAAAEVAVYRTSRHIHSGLDAFVRRQILAVDAARWGLGDLSARLDTPPWTVRWATGSHLSAALRTTIDVPANTVGIGLLDGRAVAVAGGLDGTIRVWDLASGEPVGDPIHAHHRPVSAIVTATLDGRALAVTSGGRGAAAVWDLASGEPVRRLGPHTAGARAMAIAALDGRPVAVTAHPHDGTIRISDLGTGELVGPPIDTRAQALHALAVTVLDGRPVALTAGSIGNGKVRVWDLITGKPARPPIGAHVGGVEEIVTTVLDGRPVAVTSGGSLGDGQVRVWDLASGERVGETIRTSTNGNPSLAVTTLDGRPVLVTGGAGGIVRMWDLASGRPVGRDIPARAYGMCSVAATTLDGRAVAVTGGGASDGTVQVWDLAGGGPLGRPVHAHGTPVSAVAIATVGGHRVAVSAGGFGDGEIRTWSMDGGQPVGHPVRTPVAGVRDLAVAVLDGRAVAVTTADVVGESGSGLWVWDLVSGERVGRSIEAHVNTVDVLATATLDGRAVAVTGSGVRMGDGTIRVWDLATGEAVGPPVAAGIDLRVMTVATLGTSPVVVIGDSDGTVLPWDLTARALVGRPTRSRTGAVDALATTVLSDRAVVVAGGEDGTVWAWDMITGEPTGPGIRAHPGGVRAVATTTLDGRAVTVTAGAHDHTVRVWDLATGTRRAPAYRMPEAIGGIAVHDGSIVVASGRDIAHLAIDP